LSGVDVQGCLSCDLGLFDEEVSELVFLGEDPCGVPFEEGAGLVGVVDVDHLGEGFGVDHLAHDACADGGSGVVYDDHGAVLDEFVVCVDDLESEVLDAGLEFVGVDLFVDGA